jgi:hypothetical protein
MRSIDSNVFATWTSRVALAAVLAASFATAAGAQSSGLQQTPDSARYLISKDVGAERWAISYNLNDRTVTGNVFKTDGSPPSFIWCKITNEVAAPNPANNEYTLDCYGADACAAAPCTEAQWTLIASGLPIPGSFLLPNDTKATFKGNVQPIFTQTCATNLACHVAGGAGPVDLSEGHSYAQIFEITATQDPSKFYVTPFDPVQSYLFNKIEGTGIGSQMPLGAPPLSAEQQDAIRNWILEGAAQN